MGRDLMVTTPTGGSRLSRPDATPMPGAPGSALKDAGLVLDKYTLLCRIATGGMGEIFVARQRGAGGFEKQVVIKRLLPHLAEDENFVAMLLDEARLVAALSHPNVCQVYEPGQAGNQHYIAMEKLEGVAASRLLRRAKRAGELLPMPLVAAMFRQSCDGLHHAHELADVDGRPLGLVHRDVSPSNLFVTTSGVVKVLDFGVAKSADALARTHTGALKGKYAYMSPEQVLGKPIDRRSDVFALGTVLFEFLTCRRAFWRESEYQMFQAIVEDPIPTVEAHRANVPPAVAAVVARALSRDPARRFATAAEVGLALERAMAGHGGLASNHDIGEHVRTHFGEELAAERQLVQDGLAVAARSEGPRRADSVRSRPAESIQIVVEDSAPAGAGRGRRIGLLVGGLVAVAAGAVAVWQLRSSPPPAPAVVVYGGEVATTDGKVTRVGGPDGASAGLAPAPPDAGPAVAVAPVAPPADAGPRPVEPRPVRARDPYREALGRKAGAIRACFNQHAASIAGQPEISLELEFSSDGKATHAGILPAAIAPTALGGCLIGVARAVRVDAADGGTTVTIPLKIRRK